MSKLIVFLSFLSLGILIVLSIFAPNSSAIWLASTQASYNVLRAGVMALLLTLLVTEPPRNVWLRAIVGGLATALGIWSLSATYQNEMQLLDGASLLTASIAMTITTLEHLPERRLLASRRNTAHA
jgi:hypothetical protein